MTDPNAAVDPDTATLARLTALSRAERDRRIGYERAAADAKWAKAEWAKARKARDDFVVGLSTPLPLFDGEAPPSGYPAVPGTPLTPEPPARRTRRPRRGVPEGEDGRSEGRGGEVPRAGV